MPSPSHEVPIELLRKHPELLAALLEKLAGAAPKGRLEADDATLRFAKPAEVRPDLVFRCEHPPWVLLEVQIGMDAEKSRRWLLAAAIQLNETRVMGEVVVLTTSRRVAAWAARVGQAEGAFGTRLALNPLVLLIAGKSIDAMLSADHPELAFFAVWAVRGRHGPRAKHVLREALRLTDTLPEALQPGAARAIFAVLREPLAAYFREILMNPENLPETRAARRIRVSFEKVGREQGLVEGKREGLAEGKRGTLLHLLAARGLVVSEPQCVKIRACTDPAQLDAWIVRAATASTAGEALGEES